MTIIDFLSKVDYTEVKDFSLSTIQNLVRDASMLYVKRCESAFNAVDLERENALREADIYFNRALTDINQVYKEQHLHCSKDYKKKGITAWSSNKIQLSDILSQQFNFDFHRMIYAKRTRVKYTEEKILFAIKIATAMLFAKNEDVYLFQIQASFFKLIVDFFLLDAYDYKNLSNVLVKFINMDVSEIYSAIDFYGLVPEKKKPPKEQKKQKYNFPTKKEFEMWINSGKYKMKYIKETIAQQLNCSPRTVHRKLQEYGLIRNYEYRN